MDAKRRDIPLSPSELKTCKLPKPTDRPPDRLDITLASFKVPSGSKPRLVEDACGSDTYRVKIEVSGEDTRPRIPYERIAVSELNRDTLEQFRHVRELTGSRPGYAPASFIPELSKFDAKHAKRLRKGEDRPTNIFGNDDRYVYSDSTFPWRTVGRVSTANGVCSGCTIGPRLVLTASHCIDWIDGGGAGWVNFSPAYYNGNGSWGEFNATRVISWNRAEGGLSDFETAFDYVVLVMDDRVGDMVGYPGYRTYDDDWNDLNVWQHMGYPGDLTSTQRPAFQGDCSISSVGSQSLPGQTGYVLGHFNDATGGHSGGPVWGWWSGEEWPRVVGVQSAEAAVPASNTSGDNEFGGGPALAALISWARSNYP